MEEELKDEEEKLQQLRKKPDPPTWEKKQKEANADAIDVDNDAEADQPCDDTSERATRLLQDHRDLFVQLEQGGDLKAMMLALVTVLQDGVPEAE